MEDLSGVRGRPMFVTDLDGTLRGPDGMDASGLRALDRMGGLSVVRVLATGRSPFSLERLTGGEDPPVDYLVLSSGAAVRRARSRAWIRAATMDAEAAEMAVGLMEEMGLDFSVHTAVPDNHCFGYRTGDPPDPDLARRIELYEGYCSPLPPGPPRWPVSQMVAVVPPGRGREELELLRGALDGRCSVIRTTSPLDGESMWIELLPAGVSKSSGVAMVASAEGVRREETAAVGNDYNDRDLLEWAACSYVVSGSPFPHPEGSVTVAPAGEGGVAEAARLWLSSRGLLPSGEEWP